MTVNDNTCRGPRDLLVDYDDGALTDRQAAEVERHLAACPSCRQELEDLRRSLLLAREIWEEAAAELEPLEVRPPARKPTNVIKRIAATAAAAAIVAGAALWAWTALSHKDPPMTAKGPEPASVAEAVRIIEREAAAAKLAASAEILAAQPATSEFAAAAMRYVAAAYGDTVAGKEAARKITTN